MENSGFIQRDVLRRRRVAVVIGALVLALALVEFGNALLAPSRAPTDRDWTAAAQAVRADWRPGDLIVAAPEYADPILRQHLGDLLPQPVVGRMDAARYGRIWEVSQRGARSDEGRGQRASRESRHGALTLRLFERKPAVVTFDFFAKWREGQASYVTPDGRDIPCVLQESQFQCIEAALFLRRQMLEIDTQPRVGIGTIPSVTGTTVLEWKNVPMGAELAVGAGLHNVWLRKSSDGVVTLRVLVDGAERGVIESKSLSGFTVRAFDTRDLAGRTATVRFEITTNNPAGRYLGFVAEARTP